MIARPFDFMAADGTRLGGTVREPAGATGLPVLCLPGLTRNGRDFDVLADALASGTWPRTVVTMDFRGRGRSAFADPATYRPDVEAADVIAGLDHLGIGTTALVGTSRGGIVGMILAATAPARLGPVVLNDIGPVIELSGLRAIADRMTLTLGHVIDSWDAAVADLKATMGRTFTALGDDDWLAVARAMYREDEAGRPVLDYDPKLLQAFASFDPAVGLPPFWPLYEALKDRPVLVIRGERSDLLSEATVAEMAARLPRVTVHRVPDQGHAPLLTDAATIGVIRSFLDGADAGAGR
ncbi:alpha/beta fold hydrolase [Chthonobacter rhizosphaerae]|uniref:alpha/beta fold hydrolase n=1 Tax=Chthonobacter rhizosphaerae TaxID=2735553 RepID=UPI0015EF10B1|nr:alpha/beta hydrolase [Chthonobacter rhizosphaerae]